MHLLGWSFFTLFFLLQYPLQSQNVYKLSNGEKIVEKANLLQFVQKASFVNAQKNNEIDNLLGDPDFESKVEHSCTVLEAGNAMILEFGALGIRDVKGTDIYVFNLKKMSKLDVYLSSDLSEWIKVGTVTDQNPYLDINGEVKRSIRFRYMKIINSDSATVPIYLDAIAVVRDEMKRGLQPMEIDSDTLFLSQGQVYIRIKDNKKWDGDRVTLYLNGKKLLKNKFLSKIGKKLKVDLKSGVNILKVKAHNQGLINPNTSKLEIIDDHFRHYKVIRLKKEKVKSLIIILE